MPPIRIILSAFTVERLSNGWTMSPLLDTTVTAPFTTDDTGRFGPFESSRTPRSEFTGPIKRMEILRFLDDASRRANLRELTT